MEVIRRYFELAKTLFLKYERRISSAALVFGFVVDSFTLRRIDLLFEQVILLTHLFIAGSAILYINIYDSRDSVSKVRVLSFVRRGAPVAMQFSFGALFSGFLIFYSRSASLVASWPFLILLVALLVGNEFFRKRYQRFVFQLSIFYTALFSFLIFYVPVVVNSIGVWVFLLSGAISLIAISAVVWGIAQLADRSYEKSKLYLKRSIVGIFVAINVLYFTNIIPPIPLSLKDAEVAHLVRPLNGEYLVQDEKSVWYEILRPYDVIHTTREGTVYFFSSVFAPTKLTTNIVHHWEYKNKAGDWVTHSRLEFPIRGGRDEGYRVYSFSRQPLEGWWRVSVETPRGQLLGRERFKVIEVSTLPTLKTFTY